MKRRVIACLLYCSLFAQAGVLANRPINKGQSQTRGQTNQKQNTAATASAALDYDESHALILGISHYLNGWRDLPGVRRDVEEVRATLLKQGFQVIAKLDLRQAELDRALRDFVGAYGQRAKNRLVIYFAGHGHTLTTNDGRPLGYIVPADAPLPDDKNPGPFKSLAISMSDIEKFAREIESKHALFVFDSCFSGSLFRVRSSAVPDSISAMTDAQVRHFITAGTEKQSVPDESVFRRQFVRALAGEGDYDRDGFITGTELGYFLRNTVTDYTKKMQTPESGKIRDPDLDKGDIVFVSPLGSKPGPSLPPPPLVSEVSRPPRLEATPVNDNRRWVVVFEEPIRVEANAGWVDTGVQVKNEQEVWIKGGSAQLNLGALGSAGSSGVSKTDGRKPLGNCPTGALIARLGTEMICIKSEQRFKASAAGQLWLGINESDLTDNTGAWIVRVVVQEFR